MSRITFAQTVSLRMIVTQATSLRKKIFDSKQVACPTISSKNNALSAYPFSAQNSVTIYN